MAYVPDYGHDLFVSYAHLDNRGEMAWVTNLVRHLETETSARLGTKDLRISIDHDLDGNRPLTVEIVERIRQSATLLVIMSPGYIASAWCARERNAFLAFARECVSDGRIFIVHCREIEPLALPPEFGDLIGFKFWTRAAGAGGGVARPLGLTHVDEPAYFDSVINLSDRLARKLREMRAAGTGGVRSFAPTAAEHIFLARSTDDMEAREAELVGYLTQAGLGILPQAWYREDDHQEFRAAMQADLRRCSAFVQLLGRLPGRRAKFAGDRRFPTVQYDIAKESGKAILQWRELVDDSATVEDQGHRALLDGARACGFEEFKRAIVEAARRKPQIPTPRSANVAVFVNADGSDLDIARQLSQLLAEQGVECYWPITEGSPEKVRLDLEANLKACDGLVLIYGASEPSWVRDQLRQGRKILSQRDRPLAAMAICLGPPPQKTELAVALPGLVMLDGRAGISSLILDQFVERLTVEA
jgi:hypothetical protein